MFEILDTILFLVIVMIFIPRWREWTCEGFVKVV